MKTICRNQACNSEICEYLSIRFADFMIKGENLLDYANLFSHDYYIIMVK